jgi:tetratricopeptide (TPR) repeat protein
MQKVLITVIAGVLWAGSSLLAQGPPPPPLTQKELVDILKSKQQSAQAAVIVEHRGVNFELTPEIEKQLRKAKATDAVMEAVKNATPSARAAHAAATGAVLASEDEQREMLAIQNELNPDAAVQMAQDFAQKHPQSPLLTYVYALAAAQYEQKGDAANVIAQCEKSLALKPDNLMALLMIAQMLPQQQSVQLGNVDQKLDQAEKYAAQALELVSKLTPQPNEPPDKFTARQASYVRDMHSALGMVHFQRAMQSLGEPDAGELTKAEAEYTTAVTVSGSPLSTDYFRLGEVRGFLKKYDAAIEAYNKCLELDTTAMIRPYAEQAIASVQKAKAKASDKP